MPPAPIKINACVWQDYLSTQHAHLPRLPDVEHLSPRVTRVIGGNPGSMKLQGTNTYLVGTGRSKVLIDTAEGLPAWISNLTTLLEANDWHISHVLLTHWHGDHVGGVPDLIAYRSEYADRIYKNQPDPGQRDISNGQLFSVEGASIRAVATPGHAVDHMCFVLEEENAMFTGDNVLGHGFSVVEDLGVYTQSLKRMKQQACATGYPAHGIEISNLPEKMDEYIRHKAMRESQTHTALMKHTHQRRGMGGARQTLSTRELVGAMYGPIPEEMYELAVEPLIVEVLGKLAEDRKAGFVVQEGCQRWFGKPTQMQAAL